MKITGANVQMNNPIPVIATPLMKEHKESLGKWEDGNPGWREV
jgi:hypothetical protein